MLNIVYFCFFQASPTNLNKSLCCFCGNCFFNTGIIFLTNKLYSDGFLPLPLPFDFFDFDFLGGGDASLFADLRALFQPDPKSDVFASHSGTLNCFETFTDFLPDLRVVLREFFRGFL